MGDASKVPSERKLKKAFYEYSCGKEELDIEGFKHLCYKFYLAPTTKAASELFHQLDKNSDSQLSFEEVSQLVERQWSPMDERKLSFKRDFERCRKREGQFGIQVSYPSEQKETEEPTQETAPEIQQETAPEIQQETAPENQQNDEKVEQQSDQKKDETVLEAVDEQKNVEADQSKQADAVGDVKQEEQVVSEQSKDEEKVEEGQKEE
ncbi:hypothetical protein MAR_032313 [Mya arenaria]|uniref:EF-hand domain-containing protein n=1 Tax=Mya arenaria TaxID=6604 RepID=A0ABY7FA97_MYAAR|nr:hypothetical protein MAR_032313 [Mya arenaria]